MFHRLKFRCKAANVNEEKLRGVSGCEGHLCSIPEEEQSDLGTFVFLFSDRYTEAGV